MENAWWMHWQGLTKPTLKLALSREWIHPELISLARLLVRPRRHAFTHISSRKYEASNYDTEKDIPLKNCAWTVDGSEVVPTIESLKCSTSGITTSGPWEQSPSEEFPACVKPVFNNWTKSWRLVTLTGSYNPCAKRLEIATLNH
jgi:hypothetical protein